MSSIICISDDNSRCTTEGHKRNRIDSKDEQCKIGRAWKKNAVICIVCGNSTPVHLCLKLNPAISIALRNRTMISPVVSASGRKIMSDIFSAIYEGRDLNVCPDHNIDWASIVNAHNPDNAGKILCNGVWQQIIISSEEQKNLEEHKKKGILSLITKINSGDFVTYSERLERDGQTLNQCVVYTNSPAICMCNKEWHKADMMSALTRISSGKKQVFAFGEGCASTAKKAGIDMQDNFAHALVELGIAPHTVGKTSHTVSEKQVFHKWNGTPVDVANKILDDQFVRWRRSELHDNGQRINFCTVSVNTYAGCKCGGTHTIDKMKCIVHGRRVFMFGPACTNELALAGFTLEDDVLLALKRVQDNVSQSNYRDVTGDCNYKTPWGSRKFRFGDIAHYKKEKK